MRHHNLRAIMRLTGGFSAFAAAAVWAAPVFANVEIAVPVGSVSIAGQGSAGSVEAPPLAAISFSRAADLPNQQQIYFSKASFSGPSAVILMSTNRRAIRAAAAPVQRRPQALIGTGMALAAIPSQMPVAARALTSGFGMRGHPLLGGRRAHSGIDLAAPAGSPIVATSDGQVSWADWAGGYGIAVAVEHGGGYQTRYAHMSRVNVAPGQQVRKGDVIGYVGSTGLSTGPHLHYEVRVNGQAVNPVPMLGR